MKNRKGFTLIELLVVVLIIGILASVALPQYQKAVLKSRMVNWTVALDALKKNIDMYHLENGSPTSGIEFAGTYGEENRTLELHCDAEGANYCLINKPKVEIHSMSEDVLGRKSYRIIFVAEPQDFGVSNTVFVSFIKDAQTGKWSASAEKGDLPRMVCEWVQGLGYPGREDIVSVCAAVGVTLTPYVQ